MTSSHKQTQCQLILPKTRNHLVISCRTSAHKHHTSSRVVRLSTNITESLKSLEPARNKLCQQSTRKCTELKTSHWKQPTQEPCQRSLSSLTIKIYIKETEKKMTITRSFSVEIRRWPGNHVINIFLFFRRIRQVKIRFDYRWMTAYWVGKL